MPARKTTPKVKNLKEKPEININEQSSPEEILHASWTFINTVQFFSMFRSCFRLKKISIDRLERALVSSDPLSPESRASSVSSSSSSSSSDYGTSYLQYFFTHILSPLLKASLRSQSLDKQLTHVLKRNIVFCDLTVIEKIQVLKEIRDRHVERQEHDEAFQVIKSESLPTDLRIEPLGSDYQGWTYWYFVDMDRLYRELPIPLGKRGQDTFPDFTFELVADDKITWQYVLYLFQPSRRTSCKELSTKILGIAADMIERLEQKEAAELRHLQKLKKQQELELIPKKRSRRLEAKQDEHAKRQKIIEVEQQRLEMEEIQLKLAMKQEKERIEREKQALRSAEARLKYDVHAYLTEAMSHDHTLDKEIRNQISTKATEQDRIHRMQTWIKVLNCDADVTLVDRALVQFRGPVDMQNVLFKNILRVLLTTLVKYHTTEEDAHLDSLNDIYKNLVLDKYDSIEAFCEDFNKDLWPLKAQLLYDVFDIKQDVLMDSQVSVASHLQQLQVDSQRIQD